MTTAEDGVAIVVLTHNRVHLLRQCVENVLLRTSDATREIVIWDNGSTDGTAEYLASIEDPRFKIIRSETNVGFNGYARGFRQTDSFYMVELDDDVTDAPANWDLTMRDAMRALPGVGFLAADLVDDPNDQASQYRWVTNAHLYSRVEENGVPLLTGPAGGGCAMTTREANVKAGGFEERDGEVFWLEDHTYIKQVMNAGFRVTVLADLRVHHTGGAYYTQPLKEKDEWWAGYWRARRRKDFAKRALVAVPGVRAVNARLNLFEAPEKTPGRARGRLSFAARYSEIGAGPLGRAGVFAALLALPVKRRLRTHAALPARVALGDRRSGWFWFSDESEIIALHEIFADGEYAVVGAGAPATIVDLGANAGQAALYFRSRFPDARILCVEPDPDTFAKLKRNVGRDPLVTLRKAAITAQDGTVVLERQQDSSWGTRVSADARAGVSVPGLSLQTLMDQHEIAHADLLKVDIEGMEHEALGDSPALARTTTVVGEIHADLLAVSVDQALDDMRRIGGFERSQLDGDIFVLARS